MPAIKSKRITIYVLVLVVILIDLLVPPLPVRADVGPQPILPGGSSIKPGEGTRIQMAAEIVKINVRQATEADNALVNMAPKMYGLQGYPVWYPGIAEVEADFAMKNPTSETVNMTVWFPLASALENIEWRLDRYGEIVPRIENFQVSVDGNPLDHAVSELPNPKGADKPPLPWASFPVSFTGGKETAIQVSYMVPLRPSPKGNEMDLYYIFQTGAGWDGPIGQAELILNLPYPASTQTLADMPPGTVLAGNQARWMWTDLEPGPEDDFTVSLLKPIKWQELENARAAVQANPQDGQAWLDLASTYYFLESPLFSPSYIPSSNAAYHKAVDLLPEHPAPHAGLALLALAQSTGIKPPPEVIQYMQEEYQIAKELDAKNPSLMEESGVSSGLLYLLDEALYSYVYFDATATMDAATQAVFNSTMTAEATLYYATFTAWAIEKPTYLACRTTPGAECDITASPTATPTKKFTLTATPILSTTPEPMLTPTLTNAKATGNGQSSVIVVAAGVIGLVIVSYLASKRLQKSVEK